MAQGRSVIGWTEADDAQSLVLIRALTFDYCEHRRSCPTCLACPELEAWRDHLNQCRACQGEAPLTFGPPCERRRQFLHHDKARCSCLPCPHVVAAVREVVDWHEARPLLSHAEALRAQHETRAA